jgi:hypothetical protein
MHFLDRINGVETPLDASTAALQPHDCGVHMVHAVAGSRLLYPQLSKRQVFYDADTAAQRHGLITYRTRVDVQHTGCHGTVETHARVECVVDTWHGSCRHRHTIRSGTALVHSKHSETRPHPTRVPATRLQVERRVRRPHYLTIETDGCFVGLVACLFYNGRSEIQGCCGSICSIGG